MNQAQLKPYLNNTMKINKMHGTRTHCVKYLTLADACWYTNLQLTKRTDEERKVREMNQVPKI